MGLFDFFKKKAPAQAVSEAEPDYEKMDRIAEYLRTMNQTPVFRITAKAVSESGITDSRFGGLPYWDAKKAYPTDDKGRPLYLLAQINFEKAGLDSELLPKSGILQFFIANDDQYGMNLDDMKSQNMFRIIYHEEINGDVTEESVRAMEIPANTELDPKYDAFPFYKMFDLTFARAIDHMNPNMVEFEDAMEKAVERLFGETMTVSSYRYFQNREYDYLCDKCSSFGHKMLGLPAFTQEDPRVNENLLKYDTLLLQIDSDCKDILWGDSGVCNFFINSEKLKARDFSDVIYNWDCY